MARVLLMHDAVRQVAADSLRRVLAAQGHHVALAWAEPTHRMLPDEVDIVILDVIHEAAACDLLRAWRQAGPRLGLVLLVEGDTDRDRAMRARIDGLLCGADFCESRYAGAELLSACLDAISRRVTPEAWRLDTTARTLHAPRRATLDINDKELTLLQLLADSARHAADRSAIANAFGMDWLSFDERALEKMVSRLRRKWREGTTSDLPLKTMHGVGYCFTERIQVC